MIVEVITYIALFLFIALVCVYGGYLYTVKSAPQVDPQLGISKAILYSSLPITDNATGEKTTMELSGSNVLRFEMADGTSVIVRPSGTEPKIKVYILAQGKDAADAQANVAKYGAWVETLQK